MTRPPSLTRQTIARLLIDTVPWLSCDDCFERIDSYAEAQLSGSAMRDHLMDVHLLGCPSCAEEAQSLIELITTTQGMRAAYR
ncbi:MAG: hypothetical protein Q4P32_04210 [Micrococcales bacterium]|nr:hypothetical protein [Micrococcales bacterium]